MTKNQHLGWDDRGRPLVVSDGISQGKAWGLFVVKSSGSLKRSRGVPMLDDRKRVTQLAVQYIADRTKKGWVLIGKHQPIYF